MRSKETPKNVFNQNEDPNGAQMCASNEDEKFITEKKEKKEKSPKRNKQNTNKACASVLSQNCSTP